MATTRLLEIHPWEEDGYKPLVFTDDWMVAILNWEDIFAWEKVGEIERHNETDEVFVLTKGRAVLFVVSPEGQMQVEDMQPGVIYNVPQGVWHNLIATHDASWIIVENRDTHLHDCEFRQLEVAEKARLEAELPNWVEKTT
jgi:mannose-6-phosphate isomerase-like protein (cupin superfamily)